MKKIIYIALILLYSYPVKADVCSFITLKQAQEATAILNKSQAVIHYCPGCLYSLLENELLALNNKYSDDFIDIIHTKMQENLPQESDKELIQSIEYKRVNHSEKEYYQVYINNEPVDIAYVYFDDIKSAKSLGLAVKCFDIDWYNDYYKDLKLKYPTEFVY